MQKKYLIYILILFFIINFFLFGCTQKEFNNTQDFIDNNFKNIQEDRNLFNNDFNNQELIDKKIIDSNHTDNNNYNKINSDINSQNVFNQFNYSISGKITGVVYSVIIRNNGKDDIIINPGDSNKFEFSTKLLNGEKYNITLHTNNNFQKCYLKNNQGIVNGDNIEDIIIKCNRIYRGSSTNNVSTFNLNYLTNGNGSILGNNSQTINNGEDGTEVVAIPNTGYHFVTWSDGVLTATRTDLAVTADKSVTANFDINTYSILSLSGSNGSITPLGTIVKDYNTNQNYQMIVNEGYQIADVLVDGESIGSVDLHEFSNIQEDHNISVTFELIPPSTVTVSSITPSSGYDIRSISLTSISGTGFLAGASVKLTKNGNEDINCTNIIVSSSTLISSATCDIASANDGNWNVIVTNTDTGSGQLNNGFLVKEYEIGDIGPLGGYIFYVNSNYETDGWKYLQASPSDQDTGSAWADSETYASGPSGATGVAVGTGLENTNLVLGSVDPINSAIEYALNYSLNGINDWFLPSENELNLMYGNLKLQGLGEFNASSYWSSTEVDKNYARRKSFSSGTTSTSPKLNSYGTRVVNRFLTCPTYNITYNGNGNTGGTVPTDSDLYLSGSLVTVMGEGTLTKEGYTFDGWNTSADGSGTSYASGSDYTMGSENATLYAMWYTPNYTIVIMPDTQSYVNWKPAQMTSQLDWLIDNKTKLNLKFVSHVGDLVQHWDSDLEEWEFVQNEMNKLTDSNIPYSTLPGNHDYAYMSRNSSVYNTYFPLSNFSTMPSYGGSYDSNSDNTFHILEVDANNDGYIDDELLILSLEFGPREAVINWANDILTTHSNTNAIIITHAYLDPDGNLLEHNSPHAASNGYGLGDDVYDGDDIWEKLIYDNNNVRFVFCGHDGVSTDGSGMRISYHADLSPVYQVLANYQYYPVNGAGYLVLLNFTSTTVSQRTYSPWINSYKTDAESQADWNWN